MRALWDRLVGLCSRIQFRFFVADTRAPSAEEIAYFSAHPHEIDDISEPMRLHRLFLAWAIVIGSLIVDLSKYMAKVIAPDLFTGAWKDFIVDIIFEAGVTAYFMGVLLNSQKAKTKRWRQNLRAAIDRESESRSSSS